MEIKMEGSQRPTAEETRLAREQKAELEAAFAKKRIQNFLAGATLLIASIAIAASDLPMLAFIVFLLSVIAFVNCFDAHGSLLEARRQVADRLFPNFSVLYSQRPQTHAEQQQVK
jgi:hypothetical protein